MTPLKFEDFEPRKFSNLEEKINEELKNQDISKDLELLSLCELRFGKQIIKEQKQF